MEYSSNFSGLPNLGNTCYLAASLQCFLHIPRIFHYFSVLNSKSDSKIIQNPTFSTLSALFSELTSGNLIEGKTFQSFFETFGTFCNGSQQDAQEFFKLLLEKIHEFTNKGNAKLPFKDCKYQMNKDDTIQQKIFWGLLRERDNSIITDTFCGQLGSNVICDSCKNMSRTFEDFWDISLNFKDTSHKFDQNNKKKAYNLNEMLDNFFRTEEIPDRKCSKCQYSKKAKKSLEITRFPTILVLHLKRFYYKDDRREKLNYFVKFPMKNLTFFKCKGVGKNVSIFYHLIGIIHHLGDLEHGHYFAECKDPKNGLWFEFNDDRIDFIEKEEEECLKKGSDSAYILLYEKSK